MAFHYAINIADLMRLKSDYPVFFETVIGPILTREVVKVGSGIDEMALIVDLQITSDRWEAIVGLLRNGSGKLPPQPRNLFRIYRRGDKSKHWQRL